jgi:hypothetical protein
MTHADIPLPAGLRRIVDFLLADIGRGLRELMHRHGAPDEARWANAAANLSHALAILRRLARMMRYALLLLALRVTPPPLRETAHPRAPSAPQTSRMTSFTVTTPIRARFDDDSACARPPGFSGAAQPQAERYARMVEMLRRVLRRPMPHVLRLARQLRRMVVVIGWRLPKRAPRLRAFWEELVEAHLECVWQLRCWRLDSG